jgi:hypothetical protein
MERTASELREAILSAQTYASDEVSVDTVLQKLADGVYQAWDFNTVIVVTCVATYETHSRLRICYAAGDLEGDKLATSLDVLEKFAESIGCSGVEIYGRAGWVRKLKQFGYDQQYAVVLKRI